MSENNLRRQVVTMVVEPNARSRFDPQYPRQGAFAHLQRFAPHVLPIELEQVERKQKHPPVLAPVSQPVEHRQPIVITGDRLAVD